MEIEKGIEIFDLALFIREKKLLILSDVHIGYESELTRKGIFVPKFHFKELVQRLGKIVLQTQPETVIIMGDLKHEFGSISDQEWRDIIRLFDFLSKTAKKIIVVKGNHDLALGPITRKRNVELVDYYSLIVGKKKIYICHGDQVPRDINFIRADIIIMGHEHPAIMIRDSVRVEKFKCFLRGRWKRKTLLVLPSMNPITEGTDVGSEKLLSPFLQQDISNFEIFVVGVDIVLQFGKLKNLR